MKTQLIMLDTPIIVSDEKPQANDIIYVNNDVYNHEIRTFTTAFGDANLDDCIKIVAIDKSYDKYNHSLPSIDWNGLEEEFGYDKFLIKCNDLETQSFEGWSDDSISGYLTALITLKKQYQSLNKKKFSLEDMKKAYREGFKQRVEPKPNNAEIFFNSLQQLKIFDIEIDTEWNGGRAGDSRDEPKITNNSIKILRKL